MSTIQSLPDVPRLAPKHGGTFIAFTQDRTVVQRGIPDFQCGDIASHYAPVTFDRDLYVDCAKCRETRSRYSSPEALSWARDRDSYWCNDCQGTGWTLEPWEAVYARLQIKPHRLSGVSS